jgi:hypothetical protein
MIELGMAWNRVRENKPAGIDVLSLDDADSLYSFYVAGLKVNVPLGAADQHCQSCSWTMEVRNERAGLNRQSSDS